QRWRGAAPVRCRPGQRRRGGPLQRRFLQRPAGHPDGDQPPERCQHHRDGQPDQGAVAGAAIPAARRRRSAAGVRSLAGDQGDP
nr:hypothetical protein [Tanacetum cinerariifolium]